MDISNFLAAPMVSMFPGDYGAEVVNVEPDFMVCRQTFPAPNLRPREGARRFCRFRQVADANQVVDGQAEDEHP